MNVIQSGNLCAFVGKNGAPSGGIIVLNQTGAQIMAHQQLLVLNGFLTLCGSTFSASQFLSNALSALPVSSNPFTGQNPGPLVCFTCDPVPSFNSIRGSAPYGVGGGVNISLEGGAANALVIVNPIPNSPQPGAVFVPSNYCFVWNGSESTIVNGLRIVSVYSPVIASMGLGPV